MPKTGGALLLNKVETVMKDLNYSLEQVERAKPIISTLLHGGEIKAVEGKDEEICKILDLTCGTDYFQVYSDKGLVLGVGSRFQSIKSGCKPFNTFTIRKERESGNITEFEKRKYAIKHQGIYPFFTMHGYYDETTREILSLAIAKTVDIWDCIEKGYCKEKHTGQNQIGQAVFYCIDWIEFKRKGYKLLKYERL